MLSIEFFPPKSEQGLIKLEHVQKQLSILQPEYYSVTYGAGGSTHAGTWNTVMQFHSQGLKVAPHLSCVGANKEQLKRLLFAYRSAGIRKIVALRGDMPSGTVGYGDCRYASDLVALIRQETGDWFDIAVAAYPEMHPQAGSYAQDMNHFVEKVNAGANSAITQYFYNADAFIDFVNFAQQKGVKIPIIAGIMPIQQYAQLVRFSHACGAEIPRWLRYRLEDLQHDDASLRDFAIDMVAQLCQRLLDIKVDGIHFYTLNQASSTLAIAEKLGLAAKLS